MSSGVRTSSPAAPAVERPSVSAGSLWSGRIQSPLVVLFLLIGGITKVMRISAVLAVSVQLGLSETVIAALGVTLLVCLLSTHVDSQVPCCRPAISATPSQLS